MVDAAERQADFSLVEANCAALCLSFKGDLDTSVLTFPGLYRRAAARVKGKMGDEPDLTGDSDTRVQLNPVERFMTRRAAGFVIDHPRLLVLEQVRGYMAGPDILDVDDVADAIADFRETVARPAVARFVNDAERLREQL